MSWMHCSLFINNFLLWILLCWLPLLSRALLTKSIHVSLSSYCCFSLTSYSDTSSYSFSVCRSRACHKCSDVFISHVRFCNALWMPRQRQKTCLLFTEVRVPAPICASCTGSSSAILRPVVLFASAVFRPSLLLRMYPRKTSSRHTCERVPFFLACNCAPLWHDLDLVAALHLIQQGYVEHITINTQQEQKKSRLQTSYECDAGNRMWKYFSKTKKTYCNGTNNSSFSVRITLIDHSGLYIAYEALQNQ